MLVQLVEPYQGDTAVVAGRIRMGPHRRAVAGVVTVAGTGSGVFSISPAGVPGDSVSGTGGAVVLNNFPTVWASGLLPLPLPKPPFRGMVPCIFDLIGPSLGVGMPFTKLPLELMRSCPGDPILLT